MSDLDIFKGNSLISQDLLKDLLETNKRLMGSGGGMPRISIRGSRFRLIEGGEQVSVSKSDTMNVLIIDAADVSRTYYEGTYDPENPSGPVCWSQDSKVPSPDVPDDQRQSARCADCQFNVKGSGQGSSRACRFSQRLALFLEGDLEKVYQMQIPAASIFGEAKGSDMGLQAYVKFLHARGAPVQAVLTELRFDENSESPKLFFKPVRALTEEEVQAVLGKRGGEEVSKALTMTVYQADSTGGADTETKAEPKPKPKPRPAKAKEEVEEVEDEEEVEEPKKSSRKAKPVPDEDGGSDDLASLLEEWDD